MQNISAADAGTQVSSLCMYTALRLLVILICATTGLSSAQARERADAMWVYRTDDLLKSPSETGDLLGFCQQRHITDLYWATHYRRDGADTAHIEDAPALRDLLRRATAAQIRVHALSGDPGDFLPKNHPRVLARVEATLRFNETGEAGAGFAGVHFDIEPHAHPSWKEASNAERCSMLTDFVMLHGKASRFLHEQAPGLIYGADVVFWLGKRNPEGTAVYPVTIDGKTADPEEHLLRQVDQLALMSYRGFAEGPNGIISLVSRTIEKADSTAARVFVGVKMANIGPPLETYYGQTEEAMQRSLATINSAFQSHRSYRGIAYFMYSAYRAMPPK